MSDTMNRALAVTSLWALVLGGACGGTGSPDKDKHDHGASGGHGADSISTLRYGKHTELFVEYPPMVAAAGVTFTAHFTLLGKRFLPVRKGSLVVTFRGVSGEARRITAARPTRPGIFVVSGKAPATGEYLLHFELNAEGVTDRVSFMVRVYPSVAAAAHRKKEPHPAGDQLSFLKEQQWVIPFATATSRRRSIRDGFEVAGTVEAAPGAHARLTAPIAGVVSDLATLRVGSRVRLNQTLVDLEPVLLQGTDLPQLRLAAIHARQALRLAELRRDRLRKMLQARAVARLEVDRAEYEVKRHKAALGAAGSRLWLHQRSRKRQTKSGHGLRIRAPFAGTVVRRSVSRGAAVKAGQLLVEIADLSRLRVVAHVAVGDVDRALQTAGASVRLAKGRWVSVRHPPAVGVTVDPLTRTVPFAYDWSAIEAPPLGSWVRVKLLDSKRNIVAIPRSAVLDNDGQSVVLVQTGGESFVMRKVDLGVRDRGWIEVTQGVGADERVVTRGGYQMLLATKLRGGAQLGHGHAH